MNAEQGDWFVGSPTGIRTRIDCETPSGAHPLTPDQIRQRYITEVSNSALAVWHLPDSGIGGMRAGIDEVAWRDADVAYFETSFCRPAKGFGHVRLTAYCRNGQIRSLLSSDRYDSIIIEWHLAAAARLGRIYPGLTRVRDDGCDA